MYMCRIGRGFDPQDYWEYEQIEAVLDGLVRNRLIMESRDLEAFLYGKFENPLLGLIACYALLEQSKVDYERLLRITNNIRHLLPHSPDSALISFLVEARGRSSQMRRWHSSWKFVDPPLLAKGTEHVMRLAAEDERFCPADSWLAGIALRLTVGSAWTRWDADIDVSDARRRLQTILGTLHEETPNLSAANLARIFRLPLSVIIQEYEKVVREPVAARESATVSDVKPEIERRYHKYVQEVLQTVDSAIKLLGRRENILPAQLRKVRKSLESTWKPLRSLPELLETVYPERKIISSRMQYQLNAQLEYAMECMIEFENLIEKPLQEKYQLQLSFLQKKCLEKLETLARTLRDVDKLID
ncbi:MAG TPA: hypothetical protein VNG51_27075 [Ktedonobacteraceae bacterium]|nr:hypothetical protein [Ktedonobacteraceae bacterium]